MPEESEEVDPNLDVSKIIVDDIDEDDEVGEQAEDIPAFMVDKLGSTIKKAITLVLTTKPIDEDQL